MLKAINGQKLSYIFQNGFTIPSIYRTGRDLVVGNFKCTCNGIYERMSNSLRIILTYGRFIVFNASFPTNRNDFITLVEQLGMDINEVLNFTWKESLERIYTISYSFLPQKISRGPICENLAFPIKEHLLNH